LAASLPGVCLIIIEPGGFGLHGATGIVKKEQTEFVGRHAGDKRFGFVERRAKPGHDVLRVERFGALQALPFGVNPTFVS
jgi:hypothetical protein